MKIAFIAVVMLLTLPISAHAKASWVGGAGTCSCGQWIKDRKDEDSGKDYQYLEWIHGYVSGRNWSGKETHLPDDDAITAFLDLYCKNNPLDTIFAATLVLMQESGGPKTKHQWKK